jgi:hypothetical protein
MKLNIDIPVPEGSESWLGSWGMARLGNTRKSMTTFLLGDLASVVRKKKRRKKTGGKCCSTRTGERGGNKQKKRRVELLCLGYIL